MTTNKKELFKKKLTAQLSQEFSNYRFRNNLTQAQFARMLGIDARAYFSIEHGTSLPSLMTLLQYMCICLTPEEANGFVQNISRSLK